jgi:hypothetical protein
MTMFHTDVSPTMRKSPVGANHTVSPSTDATLTRSAKYLIHALRNRLVVVSAAAEMLDPVSTGPDSPSWTWGGTLRDEVISLSHTIDSLEATLPIETSRHHTTFLAEELTASTIRLFKKFGLSGRSASLPAEQDIAVVVRRRSVGTLFDMIWAAQVSSADSAKKLKLSISKDAKIATVRIVSPVDSQIASDPINAEALNCVQLIASNLGVDLDMTIETDEETGERQIVSLVSFSTSEIECTGKKS